MQHTKGSKEMMDSKTGSHDCTINRAKQLPCGETELRELATLYPTPFHLFDKEELLKRADIFNDSFAWARPLTGTSFKNHFAVKATPTPRILQILHEECHMGMDCCSLGELLLCEKLGIKGEDIMFTSNNTRFEEYRKAFEMGAIINLDDYSQIDNLKKALGGSMPELVSFRFNPGPHHCIGYNQYIGEPVKNKFGLTKSQLLSGYKKCKEYGVKRFGLHTMVVTSCLKIEDIEATARMVFKLATEVKTATDISLEFVNMGGGIGVNHHPDQKPIDLRDLGFRVKALYEEIVLPNRDLHPLQIKYECGQLLTCNCAWLISRVINMKDTYRRHLGVDATMADLKIYAGDYREITIVKDPSLPTDVRKNLPDYKSVVDDPSYASPNYEGEKRDRMFDVVGSMCWEKDKFALDRVLNVNPEIGDLCIIHETGAYNGSAMGFNFNAKLTHAEILRIGRGRFEMIRRAQTYDDYFATMLFPGTT